MRVIAGTARSLPLKAPQGLNTRPTTDRIKETLFNMLQAEIPDSVFIDLFSGSGSIGVEALSRGAKKAYFVDNSPKAVSCIQENLVFTKLENRAVILKQEACSALTGIWDRYHEEEADIVFMDPPYADGCERDVLIVLREMRYVTEDTIVIAEASRKADFSWAPEAGFQVTREKCYKTNKHIFMKRIPI